MLPFHADLSREKNFHSSHVLSIPNITICTLRSIHFHEIVVFGDDPRALRGLTSKVTISKGRNSSSTAPFRSRRSSARAIASPARSATVARAFSLKLNRARSRFGEALYARTLNAPFFPDGRAVENAIRGLSHEMSDRPSNDIEPVEKSRGGYAYAAASCTRPA